MAATDMQEEPVEAQGSAEVAEPEVFAPVEQEADLADCYLAALLLIILQTVHA